MAYCRRCAFAVFALHDYRQFSIVFWGLVSSAFTSGSACLSGSSVFGEVHRSLLSNLEWRRSFRSSLFALLGPSDIALSSCGGACLALAWL